MSKSRNNNSPELRIEDEEMRSPTGNGEKRLRQSDIASVAYRLWQDRGRPDGSAEDDWFEAERQVESRGTVSQPEESLVH
jgi:hypothetical protein